MDRLGPVLVTGAAKRIGLAIARHFASAGRPVILHSSPRSLAQAQAAAQSIVAAGGRAAALGAELSDAEQARGLVERAAQPFGPLTLLVNNASLFRPDAAEDFSVEQYAAHLDVNLRAPILLAQRFARQAPEDADCAIVNIVDQRVFRLTPRYFTYTLSKAALWTATQTMAQAFAPRIRVNAIGPGPVLPSDVHGDEGFRQETSGVPLRRAVSVESVVEAAAYLAGALAVTGQLIAVDSGQHLAWKTPDVLDEDSRPQSG